MAHMVFGRRASASRRGFLKGAATAGVVSVGSLSAVALATGALTDRGEHPSTVDAEGAVGDAPIVAVLRNPSTGEFALLAGEREIVYVDKEFAARVARAVARDPRV